MGHERVSGRSPRPGCPGYGLCRRQIRPELIHHTDRGSQYTADDYQRTLRSKHVLISMSKKGDCYDNAMMESFFSTRRAELTHFHTHFEAAQASP
ncbi:MAG: DDE-type integrase/transposase/recombinase [Anaerolineae bacterium]|nr:DDE-type integrase/transposase/recombinase [Anaerolineae bacterium]